jgi:hypothetical protein
MPGLNPEENGPDPGLDTDIFWRTMNHESFLISHHLIHCTKIPLAFHRDVTSVVSPSSEIVKSRNVVDQIKLLIPHASKI